MILLPLARIETTIEVQLSEDQQRQTYISCGDKYESAGISRCRGCRAHTGSDEELSISVSWPLPDARIIIIGSYTQRHSPRS